MTGHVFPKDSRCDRFAARAGRVCGTLVAFVALCVCDLAGAQSAQMTFRVTVGGNERAAMVEVVDRGGVPYVSLKDLVGKLGGGYRAFPGRVQVDLVRQTAWMRVNETRVDASLNRFSLLHPVLRQGDAAFIAVSDVGPFFSKAFRLTLRHGPIPPPMTRREPVVPKSRPAPASLEPRREPSSILGVEPSQRSQVQTRELPGPEPVPLPDEVTSETALPVPVVAQPPERLTSLTASGHRTIQTVVIDPGHGGNDSGCKGRAGLREKDLALAVALRLERHLQGVGGLVTQLTRRQDVDLSAVDRANFANSHSGDLLISIHGGASFSPDAQGFELFCPIQDPARLPATARRPWWGSPADYALQSRDLAQAIAGSLTETTSAPNRGVHPVQCTLLEGVSMPALLIEVGCLTNAAEEALLQTEAYQARIALGIATGLQRFIAASAIPEAVP